MFSCPDTVTFIHHVTSVITNKLQTPDNCYASITESAVEIILTGFILCCSQFSFWFGIHSTVHSANSSVNSSATIKTDAFLRNINFYNMACAQPCNNGDWPSVSLRLWRQLNGLVNLGWCTPLQIISVTTNSISEKGFRFKVRWLLLYENWQIL